MTLLLKFVVVVVVFFNVGMIAGFVMAAIGSARHSYEIWEVQRDDGSTQWFTRAEDVATVLELDGRVAIRRLRVLT